jgi:hypothetical protein
MLALAYSTSCIAVHTVNPDVPALRYVQNLPTSDLEQESNFTLLRPRASFGEAHVSPMAMHPSGLAPSFIPPTIAQPSERPQTAAYALCDSPAGLLAHILDLIRPPSINRSPHELQKLEPISVNASRIVYSPFIQPSPASPVSSRSTPATGRSPQNPSTPQAGLSRVSSDAQESWTTTDILNWTMIHWLAGPEVALRWLTNSASVLPSLWMGYCDVPLGVTHFRDPSSSGTGTPQTPPEWTEAYHRVAMVRRREGRVKFPAWERPMEVVMDLRELAGILGIVPERPPVPLATMQMPPPPPPSSQ